LHKNFPADLNWCERCSQDVRGFELSQRGRCYTKYCLECVKFSVCSRHESTTSRSESDDDEDYSDDDEDYESDLGCDEIICDRCVEENTCVKCGMITCVECDCECKELRQCDGCGVSVSYLNGDKRRFQCGGEDCEITYCLDCVEGWTEQCKDCNLIFCFDCVELVDLKGANRCVHCNGLVCRKCVTRFEWCFFKL